MNDRQSGTLIITGSAFRLHSRGGKNFCPIDHGHIADGPATVIPKGTHVLPERRHRPLYRGLFFFFSLFTFFDVLGRAFFGDDMALALRLVHLEEQGCCWVVTDGLELEISLGGLERGRCISKLCSRRFDICIIFGRSLCDCLNSLETEVFALSATECVSVWLIRVYGFAGWVEI